MGDGPSVQEKPVLRKFRALSERLDAIDVKVGLAPAFYDNGTVTESDTEVAIDPANGGYQALAIASNLTGTTIRLPGTLQMASSDFEVVTLTIELTLGQNPSFMVLTTDDAEPWWSGGGATPLWTLGTHHLHLTWSPVKLAWLGSAILNYQGVA